MNENERGWMGMNNILGLSIHPCSFNQGWINPHSSIFPIHPICPENIPPMSFVCWVVHPGWGNNQTSPPCPLHIRYKINLQCYFASFFSWFYVLAKTLSHWKYIHVGGSFHGHRNAHVFVFHGVVCQVELPKHDSEYIPERTLRFCCWDHSHLHLCWGMGIGTEKSS